MQAYIAKRLLLFIPTIFMVTVAVFVILRVVPGDPAKLLLIGDFGEGNITEEALQAMRKKLGTDRHIVIQYVTWIGGMFQGDFGTSFISKFPVSQDLKEKFPTTLELTVMALIMATLIAVPLGVLSAIKQDGWIDYLTRIITIGGIALPNFWVAILMVFFLVRLFGWLAPLNYSNLWDEPTVNLQQMVFPALALSFSNMAFMARVTRSAMLEVFREDYIRTARAKGLGEQVVVFRHALKNALLPVVTVFGYQFGILLAGTVVIETIFVVPGMGKLLIYSILQRDYPVVQGIVMLIVVIVLVLNVVVDLVYAWLNPRIRYT